MTFNYESSEVDGIGYAMDRGYSVKIENRDKDKGTKWLRANASQVARIGHILAEGSEDATTPARDVHIRHAQMFTDMLNAMNARGDGTNAAVDVYAWERSDSDGHPVTAYAHVRAAVRWAVAQVLPLYADEVMETLLNSGESVEYCVRYVENENQHRMTPEKAAENQGCWVDGSRGWRAPAFMIQKAADCGFVLDNDDNALLDHYLTGDGTSVTLPGGSVVDSGAVSEFVNEKANEAEEWLNTHVALDGWSFGWNDGEFMLWPDDEWHE